MQDYRAGPQHPVVSHVLVEDRYSCTARVLPFLSKTHSWPCVWASLELTGALCCCLLSGEALLAVDEGAEALVISEHVYASPEDDPDEVPEVEEEQEEKGPVSGGVGGCVGRGDWWA